MLQMLQMFWCNIAVGFREVYEAVHFGMKWADSEEF
jgi:hypothetical protein